MKSAIGMILMFWGILNQSVFDQLIVVILY